MLVIVDFMTWFFYECKEVMLITSPLAGKSAEADLTHRVRPKDVGHEARSQKSFFEALAKKDG